ncbi:MAG: hypothetical protein ACD_25C00068G0001, partial [uncultured bacterium]
MSIISVDFPEPETPVIHTNFPNGIDSSAFFKFLPVAPFNTIFFPSMGLTTFGAGSKSINISPFICFLRSFFPTISFPDKYFPVKE